MLFVFKWEVLDENPIIIRAHCLDGNNKYCYFDIDSYIDFCYNNSRSSSQNIIKLATSDNIFEERSFIKKYSRYRKELNGHMSELSIIAKFTATYRLNYVGWLAEDELKSIDFAVHPAPLMLAFDIEASSQGNAMVKSYVETDIIEMISCVLSRYQDDKHTEIYLLYRGDYEIGNLDRVGSTQPHHINCKSELDLIDKFFQLIGDKNPDLIIGYNIYGFDFDFIIGKLQYYLHYTTMCSRPILKHFEVSTVDWQSSAYSYNNYQKISIPGRMIFDVMLYFKRFKLDKYTLEFISQTFLGEGKHPISYEEMFASFRTKTNLDKIANYCIQDSLLVIRLFNRFNIWNELCETAKIIRCDIEDIYTRGEQYKIVNQMTKECIERNVVMVKRKTGQTRDYKGASVLDPIRGVYDNCVILDFQSLYPSLIIAFNICPSTYKNDFCKDIVGLFPHCIKNLLDKRKIIKQQLKNIEDPIEKIVMDKRQNALKVCANSMYGTMGFASNPYFGCIPCAEKITDLGREVLMCTIEYIRENYKSINVIYGDTDSCILQSNSNQDSLVSISKDICEKVSQRLPPPMALNFEEYYPKIVLMTKKDT